ncbi:sensor histidine kinase [Brachybacterium sp. NPDC056505]|uniref:sensor histidine kinase n=1 Tax=Brachybacterium sp. NPDC056505 TaxID=3345843 RepID=UPI00366C699B
MPVAIPRPTAGARPTGLAAPLPIPVRGTGSEATIPTGPLGRLLTVWLPPLLAAVSWTVGLLASDALGFRHLILWALVPTLATLLLRVVLTRRARVRGAGESGLVALFAVHQALLVLTVALNPLACIYAFVGYLDAPRFLAGRAIPVSVGVTALICAFGQTGGTAGVAAAPALFVMLVLVNVLLSLGMMHLDKEREREMLTREAAVRELTEAYRENSALHEELVRRARERGVAEERTRLAREIHDTVAQGLVGVIRQLEAVPQECLDDSARRRMRTAEEAARESLVDARRAVEALAPQQLEGEDPLESLAELVARWSRTHRIVATFDADAAPSPLPHPHAVVRVTQEAMANAARHARAGALEIVLEGEPDALVLRIRDDGRGFDPAEAAAHGRGHGIPGMRSRIREIGGTLDVDSAPGEGTLLTARIPR